MSLKVIGYIFLILSIVSNRGFGNPHLGLLFASTGLVIFINIAIQQFKRKKNEK